MFRPKSSNIGLQRLLSIRKARIWRAFLIERRKFSQTRSAWLGREDSNLRMVESKSTGILNNFNGLSDETADFAPR